MLPDLTASFQSMRHMGGALAALLPNLIIAVLIVLLAQLAAIGADRAVRRIAEKTDRPIKVALVLGRLARWVVMVLGLLTAATVALPSFNVGALIGALGIGSVAIGFALKDILQNLAAGLLLLLTRPFHIGDIIVSAPHEGTVEDIQVRATLVRTADNRLVVIPNSELYTTRVVVLTSKPTRRGEITLNVGLGTDIAQAKRTIVQALAELPQLLPEPAPAVFATELGPVSVQLSVRFWVGTGSGRNLLEATDAVIVTIKKALETAQIEIANPTQVLLRGGGPAS